MRQLIPKVILDEYKILFLSVPAIDEWHLTKIDFSSLPNFSILNHSIRPDYVSPVSLYENDESALLVVDKINNHSLHSLMVLQSGRNPKRGFQELSKFEVRSLFEIYTHFINFYLDQEAYLQGFFPRFSYNHDPYTIERPGLQSIERFHAHLYLLERKNLLKGPFRREVLLKDLFFSLDYKDYFDPAAYCFERLLYDLHKSVVRPPSELELIVEPLIDKIKNGRGLGLNIFYRGPVEYFKSNLFIEYVWSLHREGQRFFSDVMNHCFEQSMLKFVDMNRVEAFMSGTNWLSEETKLHFKVLLGSLKQVSPRLIPFLQKKKKLAKDLLAYKSFCYSFSIDLLSSNEYLLNFYPRLFSEIGGAGIFACCGYNAVVIDRNRNSYFISNKVEERRIFQNEFLRKLKSQVK